MGTNVDPNKVEELAVEFKRLSRIIEDGETSVNKDIMGLIQETNSQYTESYVRSTTSEMESLLKEIRMLAVSITERLNDKSNVLKRAAEQYRHDEEEARKLLQKPVGFSLGRLIGGAFGNFFKKIREAIVAVVNKAIDFIFGKGKNKYHEPTLDLPLDVTPLKANLIMNTNVYSEEVKKLQQKLKDLGYDIEVDGYFGEQTLGVVNTYKDKYGLANTGEYNGVVDDQMWVYLFGSLSGELKLSPGMYSEEVRLAQIRLKDLGYDVEITGYFDEKTLKAVNELKEGNKLGNSGKWEGVIGPQTWGVLFGAEAMAAVVGNIASTEEKAEIAGSFNIVDGYHEDIDNAIANLLKEMKGTEKLEDTLYIQMYLWILGYNIGNSGVAGIGVDGDIGPKTLTALSNEFPNQDITNLSEIRKQLKERVAPVMLKRSRTWANIVATSGTELSKTEYPLKDPMFCLFFKNKNQNDIDPIFAGRLAAFAVDNNLVIYVGSGYRSYDEQVACYKKSGGYKDTSGNWIGGDGSAAKPGSSWHNFGEAIDISWNGEESSQYIRNLYGHKESTEEQIELIKYGIFKPLTSGNGKKGSLLEEWHIQPIETQKAKVTDRKSFYEAYKSVKLDQLPSAPNVDVNDSITGTNEQSNFQNEGMGKSIIDNLINNTSLGLSKAKKDSMINMAITLLNEGYEPAFVAGVLANILAEGAAGYFESSAYITYPDNEPAYLVYMDENYDFRDKFSGENISQVGIAETYRVLKELKKGGYKGKFGLGSVQWTGGRTMELIKCYIELYGEDYYPTIEESLIAENMMIVKELNGEYYNKRVYQKWKSEYSKNRDSTDAAYGAGIIVCKNYEIPRADSSGTRANNAEKIYKIMMGLK